MPTCLTHAPCRGVERVALLETLALVHMTLGDLQLSKRCLDEAVHFGMSLVVSSDGRVTEAAHGDSLLPPRPSRFESNPAAARATQTRGKAANARLGSLVQFATDGLHLGAVRARFARQEDGVAPAVAASSGGNVHDRSTWTTEEHNAAIAASMERLSVKYAGNM